MNSPLSGRHSDRATPSLRDAPTTEHYDSNRQRLHLSNAETCPDEPGQLFNAVHHLEQSEYAQAFILAWTVIEHCIARYWDRAIKDLAQGKLAKNPVDFISEEAQRQRKRPSEFSVSARIAALTLIHPGSGSFATAESLRTIRNDFVHDLQNVSPAHGSRAAQVALELMEANYGMNLRLGTGYGYML